MDSSEDQQIEADFNYRAREVVENQKFQRRPRRVVNLVNHLIAKRGLAGRKSQYQLADGWREIAGSKIADRTRLGTVRKGVLTVHVDNSSTLQHLSLMKQQLINDVNQEFKNLNLTDIRFKSGH